MKHYSFLILIAACCVMFSCKRSTDYTINGTVAFDDADSAMVVLNYNGEKDTTYVAGNAFTFTGKADQPDLGYIAFYDEKTPRRLACYLVVEPGVLTVELSDSSYCTGTKLNDEYYAYDARIHKEASERMEMIKSVRSDSTLTDEQRHATLDSLISEYRNGIKAVYSEVFNAHTNDPLGANALMTLSNDRESFDSLYAIAGENVKNARRVVNEKERYAHLDSTAVGKMFTDFTIENGAADGTKVSLSDYVGKGKYVLVDFWASWCGPCRGEIPNIAELYGKYKGDKFEVVGVAVWDKREDTEQALTELPITWPIIFDAQKIPTELYGIMGIPHIILFGPDGTILARDLRDQEMKDTVAKYMEEK